MSTPETRLRDRIGGARAVALIDGNIRVVGTKAELTRLGGRQDDQLEAPEPYRQGENYRSFCFAARWRAMF